MVLAHGPDDIRGGPAMPRIEHTSQFVMVPQKGIGFVNQHGGLPLLHCPKQGGRGDMGCRHGG